MKIVISGLGLIGASLALAIKKNLKECFIFGYDFPETMDQALGKKIIDQKAEPWPEICKGSDIVFLCTPLSVIKQQLKELNMVVDPDTIVTDVGSTKTELDELVKKIRFTGTYMGGHPMTGAEKSGIGAANPLLFENAVYILSTAENNRADLIHKKLYPVLESIKARTLVLDAGIHDRIMSVISHLPQLIAVALINLAGDRNNNTQPYFELAAGGFRDLTRIASSPHTLWQDILKSNRSNIDEALNEFIGLLEKYRNNLSQLSEAFENANRCRENVPRYTKGFVRPLTDVLVYVDDQVGVVARIANALSQNKIDIRDMELLKIREKEGGVFRLSFASISEANEAIQVLQSIHYQAFIRE
jgi:prephenate dehydrogenase